MMKRKHLPKKLRTLLSGVIALLFFTSLVIAHFFPENKDILSSITTPLASSIQMSKVHVTRVIDGDTIELSTGQKIRYIGIDAPELHQTDKRSTCFSEEALEANKKLVEGKEVTIEKDTSETDRYGRMLRYVYIDGIPVGQRLVSEGFARAKDYPPDSRYKTVLKFSEDMARINQKGLWAKCV